MTLQPLTSITPAPTFGWRSGRGSVAALGVAGIVAGGATVAGAQTATQPAPVAVVSLQNESANVPQGSLVLQRDSALTNAMMSVDPSPYNEYCYKDYWAVRSTKLPTAADRIPKSEVCGVIDLAEKYVHNINPRYRVDGRITKEEFVAYLVGVAFGGADLGPNPDNTRAVVQWLAAPYNSEETNFDVFSKKYDGANTLSKDDLFAAMP